jgi:hypothetical protein
LHRSPRTKNKNKIFNAGIRNHRSHRAVSQYFMALKPWTRTPEPSYETSPFKLDIGHLIRPRRRARPRPLNRKQFKSIVDVDDYEATDELN